MKRLFMALVILMPAFAWAQSWPAKPVRIVVAYPPGGGIDVMARQLAEKLAPLWGQPAVVENKPGANTIVAADSVAKSAPDGYTILMTTDATFSINPHLYSKLPYDARRDFMPVTMQGLTVVGNTANKGAGLMVRCNIYCVGCQYAKALGQDGPSGMRGPDVRCLSGPSASWK